MEQEVLILTGILVAFTFAITIALMPYLLKSLKEAGIVGIDVNKPEMDELSVLKGIEASEAPLVRIWQWPFKARCALCITGDIDAMTIWDYVRRF